MLKNYGEILKIRGAWKFSLAGFVLRMPMSLVAISTILLVKSQYGNYTLAGAVSAANMIALAIGAPVLARLVDTHGQRTIMGPSFAVSALAMSGLVASALLQAPPIFLFACAVLAGLTWGSPGALVRSRWSRIISNPKQLTSAYALEAAVDEFVFIIGPILATVLGTIIHPATGLVIAIMALTTGGFAFLSQRGSEPKVQRREPGERLPSVLRNPVVIVIALIYIGAGTMFGSTDVSVVAFTEEHHIPALAGLLLALYAFGSFSSALVYGSRSWKQPLWKLFIVGIVLLGVGSSTFLLAHNAWILGLVMMITGLTIAPTFTNAMMIVTKVVPKKQLTEGLTWTSTAMNVGTSMGAALGGRSIDAGGSQGGFLVVIAAAWAMAMLALIGLKRLKRDTLRAEERESREVRATVGDVLDTQALADVLTDGPAGETARGSGVVVDTTIETHPTPVV